MCWKQAETAFCESVVLGDVDLIWNLGIPISERDWFAT